MQTATTPDSVDFLHALDSSVRLFGAVTRGLAAGPERAAFIDSVVALFLNGKADKLPHEVRIPSSPSLWPSQLTCEHSQVESFRPFDEKAPTGQKLLIRLFTAVVGSAHRDVRRSATVCDVVPVLTCCVRVHGACYSADAPGLGGRGAGPAVRVHRDECRRQRRRGGQGA